MTQNVIRVVGARVHNLKNITVEIPRDKLVVITGLSGSGKSSLAFDTIFAEGQRRYVESLSAYARQFLGQMDKPDVDYIEGLSPAVSIDQKGTSHNPRSTVGTVTEIYDYLRLLFARAGIPHCPVCGREVAQQSAQEIVDAVEALPEGSAAADPGAAGARPQRHPPGGVRGDPQGRFRARPGGWAGATSWMMRSSMDRYKIHTIEAVVDRLVIRQHEDRAKKPRPAARRLTDSVETALKFGEGYLTVNACRGSRAERSRRAQPSKTCISPSTWPARSTAQPAGDRAAHLLVQHTARRLPGLPGAGRQAGDRPRPAHPRPGPVAERWRDRRHRSGAARAKKAAITGRRWKRWRSTTTSTWTRRCATCPRKSWT